MKLHDPWSQEYGRYLADRLRHPEDYENEKDPPWFLSFMIVLGVIVAYFIVAFLAF
ncbi:hypothetical protein [Candidatus Palauibacter sp.]|uniref:hypothetical protein n=1 Tax=Candidatus Palauibacter sp. TaxID=3101350 RepID=UPI003B5B6125